MLNKQMVVLHFLLGVLLFSPLFSYAAPQNFDRAKMLLRTHVYHDRTSDGDFYCGCEWTWNSRNNSGGKIDFKSCGYENRSPNQLNRAERIEWEHIMPAHSFGQQRQCWQHGGRANCVKTDPVFSAMEADMHNLTVAVGEVNADRSNFRFTVLPSTPKQHGQCDVKIDFKQRAAEPRDDVKGMVARVYFYMHHQYRLSMSRQQAQLFMAWDKQFPVTVWERERDRRIAKYMGHNNPFVTGEKKWTSDGVVEGVSTQASSAEEGARNPSSSNVEPTITMHDTNHGFSTYPRAVKPNSVASDAQHTTPVDIVTEHPITIAPIYGNRTSMIYHLPSCPSYRSVSASNRVVFHQESHAIAAGYRKAGNCPK